MKDPKTRRHGVVMAGGWTNNKLVRYTYFFNLDTGEFEQLGNLNTARSGVELVAIEVT